MDLELARADRHLHPVAVAARLGECLRDQRLAHSVEPQHATRRLRRAREDSLHRLRRDRPWPQLLQLAGRPRQDDDDARARVEHDARGRAGDAERERSLGESCLLADSRSEVGVGAAHPLREPARDLLDLVLEARVHSQRRPATRATSSIVRSSWVGPSPPETRQTSLVKPSRSAASRSSGSSPTIAMRDGCRPSRSASRA